MRSVITPRRSHCPARTRTWSRCWPCCLPSGSLSLRTASPVFSPFSWIRSRWRWPDTAATRSYPNLASQDTANIPKSIQDGGRTLTLQEINWQTDNTANVDGYAVGDRYTAVATYTGSATSSYVKGYTVTADYSGSVSRIALNKTRYVAVFEGTPLKPVEPAPDPDAQISAAFNWPVLLVPLGVVAMAGVGVGIALFLKHRKENEEDTE